MLNADSSLTPLILNWDHDDIVRVRLMSSAGFVEGTAAHRSLQDLCNGATWTVVAGDLVLVRESSETYRVRGIRQRIDYRIPHTEMADALARLRR